MVDATDAERTKQGIPERQSVKDWDRLSDEMVTPQTYHETRQRIIDMARNGEPFNRFGNFTCPSGSVMRLIGSAFSQRSSLLMRSEVPSYIVLPFKTWC